MNTTKNKNLILVALAVVALLSGAAAQYFEPGVAFPRTDLLFLLTGVTLSFGWYYLDSEQIQFRRGKLLNVCVIALGIVALPYYFFRSRGLKKGLVSTIVFLVAVSVWSLLQTGGAYAVYYAIQS